MSVVPVMSTEAVVVLRQLLVSAEAASFALEQTVNSGRTNGETELAEYARTTTKEATRAVYKLLDAMERHGTTAANATTASPLSHRSRRQSDPVF